MLDFRKIVALPGEGALERLEDFCEELRQLGVRPTWVAAQEDAGVRVVVVATLRHPTKGHPIGLGRDMLISDRMILDGPDDYPVYVMCQMADALARGIEGLHRKWSA